MVRFPTIRYSIKTYFGPLIFWGFHNHTMTITINIYEAILVNIGAVAEDKDKFYEAVLKLAREIGDKNENN